MRNDLLLLRRETMSLLFGLTQGETWDFFFIKLDETVGSCTVNLLRLPSAMYFSCSHCYESKVRLLTLRSTNDQRENKSFDDALNSTNHFRSSLKVNFFFI